MITEFMQVNGMQVVGVSASVFYSLGNNDEPEEHQKADEEVPMTTIGRAPPPKNVGRLIYGYVDRKKKVNLFTTNLL